MKIAVKRLIRDEKGQAMFLVLILLLISGLIIAPLLAYMGTGLIAGEVYERRTAELYAADAGVEDAVWKIQRQVPEVEGLTQCDQSTNYTITGVNGKTVDVTITLMTIWDELPFDYRVVSTATGDGSGTEIEAYISGESKYEDYSSILDNVLTSQGEFYCPNPPTPCTCEQLAELVDPGCEDENGPEPNYEDAWPDEPEELAKFADFYWQHVKDALPYYNSDTLDVEDYAATGIGPLYRDGTLSIQNTGTAGLTVQLNGTVYITDDTSIGTTNKAFTLDLHGNTIFVESDTIGDNALGIGGKCTIIGPGVIIAVGDIYFEPNIEAGMTEPIFIFSVSGTTQLQPGGDFYGAIAGSVQVELKPGNEVYYPEGGFEGYDLTFPGLSEVQLIYSIASWDMSQQ